MEAQAAFEAGIAALNSDRLVFTDETGYGTTLNFSTAWSKVGKPALVIAPTRSPNLTVMGGIANGASLSRPAGPHGGRGRGRAAGARATTAMGGQWSKSGE
jgi:hypothetical protein